MSSKTGCCPSTAWGKLETDSNYKAKGTVEKVEDIDIYKVGQVRDSGAGFTNDGKLELANVAGRKVRHLELRRLWFRGREDEAALRHTRGKG